MEAPKADTWHAYLAFSGADVVDDWTDTNANVEVHKVTWKILVQTRGSMEGCMAVKWHVEEVSRGSTC
jgi:hypothetical protein